MGYELGTFLHYLRDLYQYILYGVDPRWRSIVHDDTVGLSDARGEVLDRCIEVGLRQYRLSIVKLIDPIKNSKVYLRGCSQHSQRHLSVRMNLDIIVSQM